MYEQIIANANDQAAKFTAPARKFNALVVSHLEKLVQFQFEATKSYADLGLEQLRTALSIDGVEGLKSYVEQQNKTVAVVGKKLSTDTEVLVGLSKDFAEEVQKLAGETLPQKTSGAEPAKKAPARKTA
jgi:phasin family protein